MPIRSKVYFQGAPTRTDGQMAHLAANATAQQSEGRRRNGITRMEGATAVV